MPKFLGIIIAIIVVIAVGLYFAFGFKNDSPAQQQQAVTDPNYVEYVDSTNHVRLMHHKDWQAVSSFGFIRLIPKTMPADFQTVQIELWAPASKVSNAQFNSNPSVQITPERFVRVRHEEMPWEDANGNPMTQKATKSFIHWAVSADRNVLIEVEPRLQGSDIDPRIKKVLETLKFE